MKTPVLMSVLATLLFSYASLAQEGGNLIEVTEMASDLNKNLKDAGVLKSTCANCQVEKKIDRQLELKEKIHNLNPVYYINNPHEFVVHLKRSSKTPKKVTLNFKNGHLVCGRLMMGTNPYSGGISFDCLIQYTEYEDNDIDLDFSRLPVMKEGQEQMIELKIIKPNTNLSRYDVEVSGLNGEQFKTKKSKMFWRVGYSLDLLPIESSEAKPLAH